MPAAGPSASTSFVPTMPGPTRSAASPPSTTTLSTGPVSSDHSGYCPRDPTFTNEIFHVQIQNFGQRYRERLERSKTIDLVLHAPVTRARLEGAACTAVEIRTLDGHDAGDPRGPVRARGRRRRESPAAAALRSRAGAALPAMRAGSSAAISPTTRTSIREPWCCESRSRWASIGRGRLARDPGASSVRGVLSLRREVVERERLMNAGLFFHPRYEAHRVFATGEVKALLTLWNKVKRRAVPGAAWPYARQAVRAPHRLAVAMARKLAVRAWAGPTLANARGLRDRRSGTTTA